MHFQKLYYVLLFHCSSFILAEDEPTVDGCELINDLDKFLKFHKIQTPNEILSSKSTLCSTLSKYYDQEMKTNLEEVWKNSNNIFGGVRGTIGVLNEMMKNKSKKEFGRILEMINSDQFTFIPALLTVFSKYDQGIAEIIDSMGFVPHPSFHDMLDRSHEAYIVAEEEMKSKNVTFDPFEMNSLDDDFKDESMIELETNIKRSCHVLPQISTQFKHSAQAVFGLSSEKIGDFLNDMGLVLDGTFRLSNLAIHALERLSSPANCQTSLQLLIDLIMSMEDSVGRRQTKDIVDTVFNNNKLWFSGPLEELLSIELSEDVEIRMRIFIESLLNELDVEWLFNYINSQATQAQHHLTSSGLLTGRHRRSGFGTNLKALFHVLVPLEAFKYIDEMILPRAVYQRVHGIIKDEEEVANATELYSYQSMMNVGLQQKWSSATNPGKNMLEIWGNGPTCGVNPNAPGCDDYDKAMDKRTMYLHCSGYTCVTDNRGQEVQYAPQEDFNRLLVQNEGAENKKWASL